MGAQNNDINRTVDGDIAEGHARALIGEADEQRSRKLVAKKAPSKTVRVDESEAEGHAVLRSPDRPTELRQIARRARATVDEASEGHIKF